MSDKLNQANIPAAGISAADTSGNETSSRRDFLRAGAYDEATQSCRVIGDVERYSRFGQSRRLFITPAILERAFGRGRALEFAVHLGAPVDID